MIPEALAGGLRAVYRTRLDVPVDVDEAVLAKLGARRAGHDGNDGHGLRRTARRRVVRRVFAGGLLAAALGLAAVVWPGVLGRSGSGPGPGTLRVPASPGASLASGSAWQSRARANLASGTLDMLDAFALARAVRDGASVDSSLDLTGDGTVDSRDVDALAARAVSVGASRGAMGRGSDLSGISLAPGALHSGGRS